MKTRIPELRKELLDLTHLKSAIGLLEWDQMTNMPNDHGGHTARAETMASLEETIHQRLVSPEMENLLLRAELPPVGKSLNEDDRLIVEKVRKDFDKARKLSPEFVAESVKLYSESYTVWVEAREKSDFQIFKPNLKRIIELKKQEAKMLGYADSPYNALLDEYEPGLTVSRLDFTFSVLKYFLVPFIAKIMKKNINTQLSLHSPLGLKIDIPRQTEFIKIVITELGYNFNCGHLGVSIHPFSQSMHPTDARITVRYKEYNMFDALYSAIHEAGHAMYEQNLSQEHFGTHLGEAVSLGVHESQSRFWENIIGRSKAFWEHFHSLIIDNFPEFRSLMSLDFYKAVNAVKPSLIRVDADEVTYNLHIVLRYEIEKDLIEGKLEVDDLPRAWNQKMKEYFDLDVPDDRHGVLQDMHWSDGAFGYFPTYTLGNLYATQIHNTIQKSIPNLNLESGNNIDFPAILDWLRNNIHRHGSRYKPDQLIEIATGSRPVIYYFKKYLRQKYSAIYGL